MGDHVCDLNTNDGLEPETSWNDLSAAEIYDKWCLPGAKLGYVANRILKLLKTENLISDSAVHRLAKKKEEREIQRGYFVRMSPDGLAFLRRKMEEESTPPPETPSNTVGVELGEVNKHLKSRIVHLADDPQSVMILEVIFGGVAKAGQRAVVDDKSSRNARQWETLAEKFFNNSDWIPENTQTDTRISDLDPSTAPAEPWKPEAIRAAFSAMRSVYTKKDADFHKSGQLAMGAEGIDGDDDFFDNFSGSDVIYFYMYKLFKGQPPRYCTRANGQPSDTGVDSCSKRSVDSSGSSTDSSGKRQKQDFEISVVANEEETKRDKAITEYYTQAKTRERLNLIEKTIDGPRWAMLSEEAQDKLKKQYEVLVLQIANVDYTI